MPGVFLIELIYQGMQVVDPDPTTQRTMEFIAACVCWLWGLGIIKGFLQKSRSSGSVTSQGFTIEKSLGWFAFMVAGICTILSAPYLYGWCYEPLNTNFSRDLSGTVSNAASWLVIVLLVIGLHLLLQTTLHGLLFRFFVRRMSS